MPTDPTPAEPQDTCRAATTAIRKSILPTIPPTEFEFSTVLSSNTACLLLPGDSGRVVVRRRVTYGDWEPVRPDHWADEPGTDAQAEQSPAGPVDPERRARYAAALRTADTYAQLERRDDRRRFADAVMAVADTEQAALRTELAMKKAVIADHRVEGEALREKLAALRARVAELEQQATSTRADALREAADAAEDVATEPDPAEAAQLSHQYRNQAEQLTDLLAEVLTHFTETGHPGQPCLRTGWVPTGRVEHWRTLLAANGQERDA
ncbi:hypothetical protein [Streptomyces sp. C10-9-1]|uniref:hypothetical protein n=1 Tax=Streptomyces sp. C10-9-1 TaxID=1859285 RepID=UPI003D72B80D